MLLTSFTFTFSEAIASLKVAPEPFNVIVTVLSLTAISNVGVPALVSNVLPVIATRSLIKSNETPVKVV